MRLGVVSKPADHSDPAFAHSDRRQGRRRWRWWAGARSSGPNGEGVVVAALPRARLLAEVEAERVAEVLGLGVGEGRDVALAAVAGDAVVIQAGVAAARCWAATTHILRRIDAVALPIPRRQTALRRDGLVRDAGGVVGRGEVERGGDSLIARPEAVENSLALELVRVVVRTHAVHLRRSVSEY